MFQTSKDMGPPFSAQLLWGLVVCLAIGCNGDGRGGADESGSTTGEMVEAGSTTGRAVPEDRIGGGILVPGEADEVFVDEPPHDNSPRLPIPWHLTEQINFEERTDAGLGDDLQKLRKKTKPFTVQLTFAKVDGRQLQHLHGLSYLVGLDLFGTGIADDDISSLGELPNLSYIDFGAGNVTINGLLQLRASRNLRILLLTDVKPPLDDDAVRQIAATWPRLETLSVEGSAITDAALEHVATLKHLESLNFSNTNIADEGLRELSRLGRLKTLHAKNTNISDRGMVHVAKIASLTKLDLNFTKITDAGLKEIRPLTNLKQIYFVGTGVTDDGLEFLKPLQSLDFIGYSENNSDDAKKALEAALPLYK